MKWAKVQIALDPAGDGRYDAEYRVRQPDGSWRWVSAWGLAEFEGSGGERKPVAITILHLDWQEADGPPVRPPSRTGFGSRLIEALAQQFKGRTLLSYPPSGATCRITTEI